MMNVLQRLHHSSIVSCYLSALLPCLSGLSALQTDTDVWSALLRFFLSVFQGANYKKILRLSYDVIITYDNRKSNLR